MVKITNKNSPYFNKDVTIQEHLENDFLSVYVKDEEIIVTIHSDDLSLENAVRKPRSRKDLYLFIQNEKNTKKDIVLVLKSLIDSNLIQLKSINQEDFNTHIEESISRKDIVEKIRNLRDNEQIDFLLPNA
jgi:hypothetical protein